MRLKYGIDMPIPPVEGRVDARKVVDWMVLAEEAGWDGFSVWDHLVLDFGGPLETYDPWIIRSAAAAVTKRIRIVANVTPLPRRRPWKVAREAVTLDHLSQGRFTLGVGLGNPPSEYEAFGEVSDARVRAKKLDESLDIITGLWKGEAFSYEGEHFRLKDVTFVPRPIQQPRIPIWVGGMWPNRAPFIRAAKYDGVVPGRNWPDVLTPSDLKTILELIEARRTTLSGFDVAVGGITSGENRGRDENTLSPWIEAGATWWFEEINAVRDKTEELEERIRHGPPDV
ncbi:MAG: LLM class flavin-dependent oxidoreductase [Candidatus Thorarchaeota archaeon]|nr:LLM class flavin-dependent oxidoreductase [Candidatus Thorarchaeota archaeon]